MSSVYPEWQFLPPCYSPRFGYCSDIFFNCSAPEIITIEREQWLERCRQNRFILCPRLCVNIVQHQLVDLRSIDQGNMKFLFTKYVQGRLLDPDAFQSLRMQRVQCSGYLENLISSDLVEHQDLTFQELKLLY